MITEAQEKELKERARHLRRGILECIGIGLAGHLGGSCSSADIVSALYFYKMRYDPSNPFWPERDRFILSKGHVAILQYAALAEAGFFPKEELSSCKELGSRLQGHPDRLKTPGIEVGTGSLGQGLSLGLGMVLGNRLNHISSNVYVLMGDGEICEGQIWEAAMAAAAFHANHLVGILDHNGLQATGAIKDRMDSGDLAAKWKSFGWNVIEIDGHDFYEICDALDQADQEIKRPTVIICRTIKGKGVSFAENKVPFHNGALTKEQYEQALLELE